MSLTNFLLHFPIRLAQRRRSYPQHSLRQTPYRLRLSSRIVGRSPPSRGEHMSNPRSVSSLLFLVFCVICPRSRTRHRPRSRAPCSQPPWLSLSGTAVHTIFLVLVLVLSSLVSPPPCSGRHHHFRNNILGYSSAAQRKSTQVAGRWSGQGPTRQEQ